MPQQGSCGKESSHPGCAARGSGSWNFSLSGKQRLGLLQRRFILNIDAGLGLVNLAKQSRKDRTGTGFEKLGRALRDKGPH